jgi:hypothetical protein
MCIRASVLFIVVGVPLWVEKPCDGVIPCSSRDLPGVDMMHCFKINAELEYVVKVECDLRHVFDNDLTLTLNLLLATIQRLAVATFFATEQHAEPARCEQSQLQVH